MTDMSSSLEPSQKRHPVRPPAARRTTRKRFLVVFAVGLLAALVVFAWAVPAFATSTLPTVLHQQADSRLTYTGTWTTVKNPGASGGSFAITNKSGSSVTVRFVGTKLDWVGKKGPAYGEASVAMDGGTAVTVDLSAAKALWQQDVWNTGTLVSGIHVVTISWSGVKGADSTSTFVNVDALRVTGALLALHQQSNTDLTYKGTWTTVHTSDASGGSFAYSHASNASVTIHFTGIELAWIAKTGPAHGIAKVKVDSGAWEMIDLYSASAAWKVPVWNTGVLAEGAHTVTIQWTGTKDSAATATNIDLDALDIAGVLT